MYFFGIGIAGFCYSTQLHTTLLPALILRLDGALGAELEKSKLGRLREVGVTIAD